MSQTDFDREELLALASRHCGGQLDDASAEQLAAALRDDAAARRWFIEYLDLHSALAWASSSAAELDAALVECRPPVARRNSLARHWGHRLLATPRRIALTIATLAVALFLGIMAYTPATVFRALRWGQSPDAPVAAARISAAVDCQWATRDAALDRGTSLLAGQRLELVAGSAEVTFDNGAIVTLTGPATFIVESPSRGSLQAGMLAARVGQQARGFAIRTPGATIVDLGTEFGVSVPPRDEQTGQPLGKEELHVFTGVVEVKFASDALPPRRLLANEALRFASSAAEQTEDGGLEQLATIQRAKFPRAIDAGGELTIAAPLPADEHPPVTRGLVLWLAADGAVRCTSTGHVAVWEDMLAGDNRAAQHAQQSFAQRRPQWVSDAFNNRPAIRFDGNDYLALVGPDKLGISGQAYEMYFVARTSTPTAQFLVAGGTEEFELHINGAGNETGARFIPTGFFEGNGASDLAAHGTFSDGRPHLFTARVLADRGYRGVLEVDGRASDDPTLDDARGYSDMALRLGMRFNGQYGLAGEIAEVLVFRQNLTSAERTQLTDYLADKYQLPQP